MASLCYVQPHIEAIHARAEALDVPTPVIDALQELLQGALPTHSIYIHLLMPRISHRSKYT